ncbi:MAG: glycosyltransferase family 39 protein [Chlorobi bacterium]|nr:glycosyltransferase family 39 protein [Chlorobiota bacterium]
MAEVKRRISPVDGLFFAWLALLLWGFNGYITLWDQDEAAYAGFAKRMYEGMHYVISDFHWSGIHRKPPLHFWLMSVSYRIFGINTFAVRFFSALAVWAAVWLIRFRGARLIGTRPARLAALFMGANAFLVMLGKMAVTDGLLLFFYVWAGLSLGEYLLKNRRRALWEFYAAVALGMLVKGPPILLWAGLLWILLYFFYPDRRKVIAMKPWIWGLPVLLPFGAWLTAAAVQDPDFVRWWIDWYILRRTHSAVINQTGPPGSYFVLFFLTALPWLPVVAWTFGWIWRRRKDRSPLMRFLLLWLVAGWLPYELLPSKLPAYVLASYPALALLAGLAGEDILSGRLQPAARWWGKVAAVLSILLGSALALIAVKFGPSLPRGAGFALGLAALLHFGVGLAAWYLSRRPPQKAFSGYLAIGLIWTGVLYLGVLPAAEPLKNATYRTAKALSRIPGVKEVAVANTFGHPPSLPFYLELYAPDARLVFPSSAADTIGDSARVWILSPGQWRQWSEERKSRYRLIRIRGLNTGAVGENDYLIAVPKSQNAGS